MAEMVRALQLDVRAAAESRFQAKDKELMTTKCAFTMLLHYSGKVEEYETWRFQMIQFLSQEPHFVEFSRVNREWTYLLATSITARGCCVKCVCRSLGPTDFAREERGT